MNFILSVLIGYVFVYFRSWIIHDITRLINISGHEFQEQFLLKKAMSFDLFDVSIRRMRQLDSSIYPVDVPLRWGHLLESDYAVSTNFTHPK